MRIAPRRGSAMTWPARTSSLGLSDALAVDADMALLDQRLGQGAALHQPDAMQIAVDPQRLSA